MKIKAIAPWFGGKRTMAPKIVELLGPHSQYFEPFCGSMAVLLAKPPSSQETANDLHGDATNLAWVLQDEKKAISLYARASRTLFSETVIKTFWMDLANSDPTDEPDEERAYKWFCFSWAMRNGVAGTSRVRGNGFQIATRFTAGGGSPTVRFRNAVDSIPDWHHRLRNVVILRRDAFSLLERFEDSSKLAIYADPPYVSESRSGYSSSGATSRYEHEFFHGGGLFENDHTRLCELLKSFKQARVVVSYYDSPRVRQLYDGWSFCGFETRKMLQNQNRGQCDSKSAPEVLICNFEVTNNV